MPKFNHRVNFTEIFFYMIGSGFMPKLCPLTLWTNRLLHLAENIKVNVIISYSKVHFKWNSLAYWKRVAHFKTSSMTQAIQLIKTFLQYKCKKRYFRYLAKEKKLRKKKYSKAWEEFICGQRKKNSFEVQATKSELFTQNCRSLSDESIIHHSSHEFYMMWSNPATTSRPSSVLNKKLMIEIE